MLTNIFDSHAHYNDARFKDDAGSVITSVFNNGVCGVVNVGFNLDSSELARIQSESYPNMWFTSGVHPHDILDTPDDYIARIEQHANHAKCVAIGEIGLDYCRNEISHDLQKENFREQLILAKRLGKPVVIHSRDATQDTLEILQQSNYHNGVVHCFSGSAETAIQLVDMGWHIGFTGVVTFNNAQKAVVAATAVPLDRLLVETDCPYMAPNPNRGQRCTSDMIAHTAKKLAEIKGIPIQQLLDITCENAKLMYNIV